MALIGYLLCGVVMYNGSEAMIRASSAESGFHGNATMTRPVARMPWAWATPRDNPGVVLQRGLRLLQAEGPAGLLSGAGRFVTELRHSIYQDSRLRFYRLSISETALASVTTPVDDVHLHIIESRDDIIDLALQGCENLLHVAPGVQRRLDRGAVAACAFVGSALASIDWMALSNEVKPVVDRTPYPAALAEGEACTGGAYTLPRFRGRGIGSYRFSAEVRFLRDRGFHTCYSMIAADNTPSQRCVERYGATFEMVVHHQRLLGHNCCRRV